MKVFEDLGDCNLGKTNKKQPPPPLRLPPLRLPPRVCPPAFGICSLSAHHQPPTLPLSFVPPLFFTR
jgi:hypothetical protein